MFGRDFFLTIKHMAVLTYPEIKNILEKGSRPHTNDEKESCKLHDDHARFHIEPSMNLRGSDYAGKFAGFVAGLIDAQKMTVFNHLLRTPVETLELTEALFDEFTPIFEAQDRHFEYRFTNPQLTLDFEAYLEKKGDNTFWQTHGFEAMKSAINSIVVVDLPFVKPGEQVDRFPNPYYYLLDVKKLIDMDIDQAFRVEWIAFENRFSSNVMHIFDDRYYRTYTRKDGGAPWDLTVEAEHDLGYTPARSFWTTPFQKNSRIQKKGPQTTILTDLDWLLFLKTSLKHVELYAGFPIDVMYESKCDYKDAAGHQCDGGWLRWTEYNSTQDASGTLIETAVPCAVECKACNGGRGKSLGAGSIMIAPARASNDDPDMINALNRISADVSSMKHLMDRISEIEEEVATNMVGYIPEGLRQAMNKEQVGSMLESQKKVLSVVADNFEAIDRFVKQTMARLRYGSQAVVSVTCNYGRKWFLQSAEQQQAEYKESKANGAANFELSSQFEQYLATKYKNNPTMLERMRTLFAIEPYQNYTVGDLGTLEEKFGLNTELVRLKMDFMNYVSRFEREFENLGVFMSGISFEVKVAFVQETLLQYVREDYPEEAEQPDPGQGDPGTPPFGGPPVV